MNIIEKIKNIQGWELRQGKKELLRHIEGGAKPLTLKEAITAKCYDCCCGYPEGAQDCGVNDCPLLDGEVLYWTPIPEPPQEEA